MYLTTRNLFLFLFLLPLLGIAQSPDREVLVFVPDMDRYRFQHDFENWEDDFPVKLHIEQEGEMTYLEPIAGFNPDDEQLFLHYFIDSKVHRAGDELWLTIKEETKGVTLPQGNETVFIMVNDLELFPHLTDVFSLEQVRRMLKPRVSKLEGQIEITEALDGKLPQTITAYLPFMDWEDAKQEFSTISEASIDWRRLNFEFKIETLFSTFAFVELQSRYYPVFVSPYSDHAINWVAEENSDYLRIQMGREWERDRASKQNFFNDRYPHGLNQTDYEQLVEAFMGDRSNRVDTLIAWSRGIEEMFGHRHGEADELLMHLNQIGNYSPYDVYQDVLMDRRHEIEHDTGNDRDDVGGGLLVGMFVSLLVFLSAAFMRYRGSKIVTLQRLTAVEMMLHAFIWSSMGIYVLMHYRAGAMVIESPAVWLMFIAPIAGFYLNILYLIPNLLMKRRWFLYILSVAGLVVGFFLVVLMATNSPLSGINLVNIEGDWMWLFSDNGFSYRDVEEVILALQMALVPVGLVYGIARYLLLNRLPILQRQKEALNAELHTLKHQISPHFFFNSLNTVYSFALSEDSPQTAEAITRLSDLMRFAIYQGDQDKVALNTELEYLADYIELQRLRLNPDKHDLQYQVTGDAAQLKIAPLLLITLIENAFKHGISMSHNSYITVDLFIQDSGLILTVENSVHPAHQFEGVPVATKTEVVGGVGLVNTQQRLDLLYKGRYDWQIDAQADHYFTRLSLDLD